MKQYHRTVLPFLVILLVGSVFSQQGPSRLPVNQVTFTLYADDPVATDFIRSQSCAWIDADGDGDPDLFVANRDEANILYNNLGNGIFEKASSGPLVNDVLDSQHSTWGDYDNDGLIDALVTDRDGNNVLYRNLGNLDFERVEDGPFTFDFVNSLSGSWVDIDSDGYLDIFLGTGNDNNNRLFRNIGGGTFQEEIDDILVTSAGDGQGSVWGDYDNDGDQDLFIVSRGGRNNNLFRNDGSGNFTPITDLAISSDGGDSQSASWGDLNNDGHLDLFVTNDGDANFLYFNNGDATFSREVNSPAVADIGDFTGSTLADFNNDGWLDIFITSNSDEVEDGQNRLYFNNGDGTFTATLDTTTYIYNKSSRGTATADYDRDGDLDIYIARNGFENFLFENNGNENHWIMLSCVGRASNRSAIGSRVWAKAAIDGGESIWQMREIASQTGHFGQNSLEVEFGLGVATTVDSIRIEWPSGAEQVLTNLAADQFLTVYELAPPRVITQPPTVNSASSATLRGLVNAASFDAMVQFEWGTDSSYGNIVDADVRMVTDSSDIFVSATISGLTPGQPYFYRPVASSIQGQSFGQNRIFTTDFSNVLESGIGMDEAPSRGLAWADYDGDGDSDLFVTNSAGFDNALYRNDGSGTFTSIIAAFTEGGSSQSAAWGDFDGDGDLDLFVANALAENNALYRNDGGDNFTKIISGDIVNDQGRSFGASWVDYDSDGFVDLYVANIGANFLYKNNGNGTFSSVSVGDIVEDKENSVGASWVDYNGDGYPDVFVANTTAPGGQNNTLYQNNGDGSFTKILTGPIVSDGGVSNGGSWGDYDSDGDPDLYVANGAEGFSAENFLYRNVGNGQFERVFDSGTTDDSRQSYGSSWIDFDNDGDLDLYVANSRRDNQLFENDGSGQFTPVTFVGPVSDGGASIACGWSDYDLDGDLDLFVANAVQQNFIYESNIPVGRHMFVQTQGIFSNTFGIGSRIRMKVSLQGSQAPVWLVRDILAQSGHNAQQGVSAHFGLGEASVIDSLEILWPNGAVQTMIDVPVQDTLTIIESNGQSILSGPVVEDEANSQDVTWGDYDNDGDLDLYVANTGPNNLYRNLGDGNFERVTDGDLVTDDQLSTSATWVDYDNDGDVDLFVTNGSMDVRAANNLYQNNGDGSFLSADAGELTGSRFRSFESAWGDLDNDGDLDVIVANFANPTVVYLNQSDGTFRSDRQSTISAVANRAFGVSLADYDNDGDLDVFIANFGTNNSLFENQGNARFVQIETGDIVQNKGQSATGIWADYDLDGDLDIFVPNGRENFLYENIGSGTFTRILGSPLVTNEAFSPGAAWGDYDNDGDPDLYISNIDRPDELYRNIGGGEFVLVNALSGPASRSDSSSSINCTWADYDNDGDLDIYVAKGDFEPDSTARNRLYRFTNRANSKPANPANLSYQIIDNNTVQLVWDAGEDGETPQRALKYGLYLGTSPGGNDVIASNADNQSGFRRVIDEGSKSLTTGRLLTDVPLGEFFWSVQAIDGAFSGSEFAAEQKFRRSIEQNLAGVGLSGGIANWIDYDVDGDLDIFLTGEDAAGELKAVLYRNDSKGYTIDSLAVEMLVATGDGAAAWSDYDNDGDPDIFLSGLLADGAPSARLYRNENGILVPVVDLDEVFIDVASGAAAWADYDNDGDVDLLVAGETASGLPLTALYRNQDATFELDFGVSDILANVRHAALAWSDYDLDSDLDVFISGDSEDGVVSRLYENTDGDFRQVVAPIPGVQKAALDWGDYDNDGDPDLLLSGEFGGFKILRIYRNNRLQGFSEINPGLPGISNGSLYWADYDNDGDLDILLNGSGDDGAISQSYRNDNGQFIADEGITLWIDQVEDGYLTVGDADGDFDLDILLSGSLDAIPVSRTFLYAGAQTNRPSPPTGLQTLAVGDSVIFEWEPGEDDLTPVSGLTYNLRVGTSPGAADIFSAMSDSSGRQLLPQKGNAGHNTSWKIQGLAMDTYYWSVQTIDHSLNGSEFSAEAMIAYNPPIIVNPPADTLVGNTSPFSIDLNTVFRDPGQSVLVFSASSSDSSIVSVGIGANSTITITPLRLGSVTIELTARNDRQGFQRTDFQIEVDQTPIVGIPRYEDIAQIDQPHFVATTITDNQAIETLNTVIYFRRGGDPNFFNAPMTFGGASGEFEFMIPDFVIDDRGADFYIEATDERNLMSREWSAERYQAIRVQFPGIRRNEPQPFGTEQTAYRLFSIPYELDNNGVLATLEDELGEYDITRWRFFEILENKQVREFPNVTEIRPGHAYWLAVSTEGITLGGGPGKTIRTDEPYKIALHAGWNAIATPFNYSIPRSNLSLVSGDSIAMDHYRSRWLGNEAVDQLLPFEGYILMNASSTEADTLLIDPVIKESAGKQPGKKQVVDKSGKDEWRIEIHARNQQARDVVNIAGVSEGALNGYGLEDAPEPLFIGQYVAVYFPHPEWGKSIDAFTADIRKPFENHAIWEFELKTNFTDEVSLAFEGLEDVPEAYHVWLLDDVTMTSKDLRIDNRYSIAGRDARHPRRLKLLVGDPDEIESILDEYQVLPEQFELHQNFPNPFNPSTTVRFGLPSSGQVNLVVYNVLGQTIRELSRQEFFEAGYHTRVWDGRNDGGQKVASGVYFLRMQTAGFVKTKKMLLIE